jgi:hypothetical protein
LDFGYVVFACLWIRRYDDGIVHVIDERVVARVALHENIEYLRRRPWGAFASITCDPAGQGANAQTGISDVGQLRAAGFNVLCRPSRINDGLELIRAGLRPAAGGPTLFIHPRCTNLLAAMNKYRYSTINSQAPFKDNKHDHPVDALRYHYVNQAIAGPVRVRSY